MREAKIQNEKNSFCVEYHSVRRDFYGNIGLRQ